MCEFVLAADSILGAEAYIQTGDPLNYRQLPIVALVSDSSLLMDGICWQRDEGRNNRKQSPIGGEGQRRQLKKKKEKKVYTSRSFETFWRLW